jgi:hypothetical protein
LVAQQGICCSLNLTYNGKTEFWLDIRHSPLSTTTRENKRAKLKAYTYTIYFTVLLKLNDLKMRLYRSLVGLGVNCLAARAFHFPNASLSRKKNPSHAPLRTVSSSSSARSHPLAIPRGGASPTQLSFAGPAVASVLAGSVAGAVGVGVAFPLDTLKTKAQVLGPDKTSGMLQTVQLIWNTEGWAGFFGRFHLMTIVMLHLQGSSPSLSFQLH